MPEGADRKATEQELAEYIGKLAAELSLLTQARGLPLLTYLLVITALAAEEIAESCKGG